MDSLSTRERMIVLLMGHAKRIFWKLTVQTRAQAVYRASALGLLAGDR